jgi:hypothetical protein
LINWGRLTIDGRSWLRFRAIAHSAWPPFSTRLVLRFLPCGCAGPLPICFAKLYRPQPTSLRAQIGPRLPDQGDHRVQPLHCGWTWHDPSQHPGASAFAGVTVTQNPSSCFEIVNKLLRRVLTDPLAPCPDVQILSSVIPQHSVSTSRRPPKAYPPSRTPGCHMAPLGKRCLPFLVSVNPVVGHALRRKVGGLAGRLSRPDSLYAVFICAGQYQTIVGSNHRLDMCTNDAEYDV